MEKMEILVVKINEKALKHNVQGLFGNFSFLYAEEEGFEPPVPRGTTVFKTAAFDHSATPLCTIRRIGRQK